MKKLLLATTITLLCCFQLKADYAMPTLPHSMKHITDILDVEVTDITKEGYAKIKILAKWKASKNPALIIKGTNLSCTGGTPKMWGMKKGKRYIVLLVKDNLFEERSWFEVEKKDDSFKCKLGWYKNWFKLKEEWIDITVFKKKCKSADK